VVAIQDVHPFHLTHAKNMNTLARAVGMTLFVGAATSIGAQPSGRPGFGMMPRGPSGGASPIAATADFLLAHTGDLALTDAQVVRLAAISRRTDARRRSMMARMDSARAAARPAPGDSAGRRGRGGRPAGAPPAELQQARDQMRTDLRDAIAVLTADQQASAWMLITGGPALGMTPGGRGPISRPPAPRDVPRRPDTTERTEP
jgi:hypothetical protein